MAERQSGAPLSGRSRAQEAAKSHPNPPDPPRWGSHHIVQGLRAATHPGSVPHHGHSPRLRSAPRPLDPTPPTRVVQLRSSCRVLEWRCEPIRAFPTACVLQMYTVPSGTRISLCNARFSVPSPSRAPSAVPTTPSTSLQTRRMATSAPTRLPTWWTRFLRPTVCVSPR